MFNPALILVALLSCTTWALPLLSADGRPFHYDQPERLVAFGDIHGDFEALKTVLEGMNIIGRDGNWSAGQTLVVSMGDLLDRGPRSRQVMELLMKLEGQAELAGGRLIALLGNHEISVTEGNYSHFFLNDARSYADFAPLAGSDLKDGIAAAFSGQSPFAKWIAGRPAAITVGNTLFVHAGVEEWVTTADWAELNATIRAWLLYFQKNGPEPAPETAWTVKEHGPLLTRELAAGGIVPGVFKEWLKAAGLERVVVGHTVTESKRLVLEHPEYRGHFLMLDTGMTAKYGGELSAIEWKRGEKIRAFSFERPSGPSASLCHEYLIPRPAP